MKEYQIGLYEKAIPSSLSFEQKLITAKELGYDYIELSIDETDEKLARLDWTEEEIHTINTLCASHALPIGSICLSGHRKYPLGSAQQEKRSLEIMEKAIRLAAALGIPVIQLAGYDVYYEDSTAESKERFLKNLKRSVQLAARSGILLGFETMETPFMDTVWKAMFYVHEVGNPYLGVYPDSGNLTNASRLYHTDPCLDLKSGAGHLFALHLKETIPGHYREIPFGTGHVNFEHMIACAWKLGIRRYVTEMWYVDQPEWKDDIRSARKMMSDILDQQQ